MSTQSMYVTKDSEDRLMSVVALHGGRATLTQLREARVVPSLFVTEVVRKLVSGKRLRMDGDSSYVVVKEPAAELPQLAGTPLPETDPARQPPQTPVKSAAVPAEPRPRHPKRARKDDGTKANAKQKSCLRCRQPYNVEEFAGDPGRRPFRLCRKCGNRTPEEQTAAREVAAELKREPPEDRPPATLEQIAHKVGGEGLFVDLRYLPATKRYVERLVATGLYGNSIANCVERLIHSAILAAIAAGTITLETAQ